MNNRDFKAYRKVLADFQANRVDEALRNLEKALDLDQDVAQLQHLAGVIFLSIGNFGEAQSHFKHAVRLASAPEEAAASWVGLGRAVLSTGNLDRALACFRRAEQLHPGFEPAMSEQATVLSELGDYAQAEACARAALAISNNIKTELILARCLIFQSQMDESELLLRKLLDYPETNFLARFHLAAIAYARGQILEAEHGFRDVLRERPMYPGYIELAKTKVFVREDDSDIVTMIEVLESIRPGKDSFSKILRADLSFALAKAYDDLGLVDLAFLRLRDANSLKTETESFDMREFEQRGAKILALGKVFSDAELPDNSGNSASAPLLIASLPRCGSSLLEQMLGGHSSIRPGGEFSTLLPIMDDILAKVPECPDFRNETMLTACLAAFYDAKHKVDRIVQGENSDIRYVTEKSPIIFLYAGLITKLSHNTRTIRLHRHPLDMALSLYMQSFTRGLGWTYDFNMIAEYYLMHKRIMESLQHLVGMQILDVYYEALVYNPTRELTRILEFCDLDYETTCEQFQSRARPVWTASGFQIRQPLTTNRVGNWRRYEKYMKPLEQLLKSEILHYENTLKENHIPFNFNLGLT